MRFSQDGIWDSIQRVNYIGYSNINKTPVFGVGGASSYPPASSWTGLVNTSNDDAFTSISLPFAFNMYGDAYTIFYVCSNGYITFGTGSKAYSNLSASNPPYAKLFFGGADNSYQRVSYYSCNTYVRFRYEGTRSTSGSIGSPNIVVEGTIFNPALVVNKQSMIELRIGVNAATSGQFMIASFNGSPYTSYSLATSTSYIFVGDSSGNNFSVLSGYSATNIDY